MKVGLSLDRMPDGLSGAEHGPVIETDEAQSHGVPQWGLTA